MQHLVEDTTIAEGNTEDTATNADGEEDKEEM